MQIYYNESKDEIILNKRSHDPETFSNKGFFEDRFPLGHLLIEYIELNFNKIKNMLNAFSLHFLPQNEGDLRSNISTLNELYKNLTTFHPYFWDYFHDLQDDISKYEYLVREYLKYNTIVINADTYDKEKDLKSIILGNDELEFTFYEFDRNVNLINEEIESLSKEIKNMAIGWRRQIDYFAEINESFKKAVDFCLSSEGPKEIRHLSPIQRYYLYQLTIDKDIKDIMVGVVYRLNSIDDEDSIAIKPNNEAQLKDILDLLPQDPITIYEVYEVNVRAACYIEFFKLISKNEIINKCKNCGKYFISKTRSDTLYCDRIIDEEGKTCKNVGAMNVYREKIKDDPIMKEYNKVYKRYNARVRYGKMSQEDFFNWSEQARKMRDKAKLKEITFKEFKEWLNSN